MDNESPSAPVATGLLEVIVSSLEDALEAEQGGAGRLEIVRNLELGGFTPSFETVQQICQHVAIPVRAMLRCSESTLPGRTKSKTYCNKLTTWLRWASMAWF